MAKQQDDRTETPVDSNGTQWIDPVVQTLMHLRIPITRENYLELAYPEGMPDEWTAELEAELPEELQNQFPDICTDEVNAQVSITESSSGLLEIKRDLIASGMSEADAEAYVRQI